MIENHVMKANHFLSYSFLFLITFFTTLSCRGGVIINGTRIIYPDNEKEITVKLTNKGKYPVLVQNWIDNGNSDELPENISVPFFLTPPINRIDQGKSQTLRISRIKDINSSVNEESIYWLNVLEIPPKPNEANAEYANNLQIALRTRIKLFYRPESIKKTLSSTEAAEQLEWSVVDGDLSVTNNSPYHVSLVSIILKYNKYNEVIEGEMISPNSTRKFKTKNTISDISDKTILYEYVNDWGAVNQVNYSPGKN